MASITWPLNYGPCDGCSALADLDPADRLLVETFAIELLSRWTGGMFGTEIVTEDLNPTSASSLTTYTGRGSRPSALLLPYRWSAVTAVEIDGVPVDSFYLDGRVLTWEAPGCCACPVTVTGVRGFPVPPAGEVAAAVLACELGKSMCGDSSCALPERITSISRQGVSMTVLDQFEDLDKGHTGVWLVDSWVASVTKTPLAPTVGSPDSRRLMRLRYAH